MELKVWVEGIQRIVCGVTPNTTCQDVVFALAHATGKVGRFTLIERWHNNERHLAPDEQPLKLLLKGVEHGDDVQFILQCSENKQAPPAQTMGEASRRLSNLNSSKKSNNNNNNNHNSNGEASTIASKRPLGNSNINNNKQAINLRPNNEFMASTRPQTAKANVGNENVGVVHGVSQLGNRQLSSDANNATLPAIVPKHEKSHSNPIEPDHYRYHNNDTNNNINDELNYSADNNNNNGSGGFNQLSTKHSKSTNEINLAEVRNALERRTATTTAKIEPAASKRNDSSSIMDAYGQAGAISANGALVPPPYRDPPPPRNSPLQRPVNAETASNSSSSSTTHGVHLARSRLRNFSSDSNSNNSDYNSVADERERDEVLKPAQYAELLQLIKYQREKLSAQQMEMSKYDAEIGYLEQRERDQAQELEAISREISKANQIFCQGSEQLQTLQYVEEENELVKQQEKTLKSEIALLRAKLANCESELQQCKNKIRRLMDDIEFEQLELAQQQKTNRQDVERDFLVEMERIQSEIDQALHNTDTSNKTAESLKKEIQMIESVIAEKKRQVEQLVNEMKEVNLKSLTVTTSDEIKHLLEGHNKLGGSSRRIIGSPRQLENAVPTSKNPHGVWV